MQFFKSALIFAFAFAALVAAAPGAPVVEACGHAPGGKGPPKEHCKPLLQSCSMNSECCADICVVGVSYLTYLIKLYAHLTFGDIAVVRLSYFDLPLVRFPPEYLLWYVHPHFCGYTFSINYAPSRSWSYGDGVTVMHKKDSVS